MRQELKDVFRKYDKEALLAFMAEYTAEHIASYEYIKEGNSFIARDRYIELFKEELTSQLNERI